MLGERLLIVSPGIRPVDNRVVDDDQKRTVTVEQAFGKGADYIVMGRPIRAVGRPARGQRWRFRARSRGSSPSPTSH